LGEGFKNFTCTLLLFRHIQVERQLYSFEGAALVETETGATSGEAIGSRLVGSAKGNGADCALGDSEGTLGCTVGFLLEIGCAIGDCEGKSGDTIGSKTGVRGEAKGSCPVGSIIGEFAGSAIGDLEDMRGEAMGS
jgi:hypothetical protein